MPEGSQLMAGKKIRTLLIEDSSLMRIMVSDILRGDPQIELTGTARNGKEGFEKTKALHPDVVITDMVMPGYDGLYAVNQIMKEVPTPIILLSSLEKTNPQIFDALGAGALDFVDKPQRSDGNGFDVSSKRLRRLVKSAALIKPASLIARSVKRNTLQHSFSGSLNYDVIVIGASTGGPGAVELIVKNLPANLSIPVVIAQHMPERFLLSFAQRLNEYTPLQVKIAAAEERLQGGTVYIAPGRRNLKVVGSNKKGETKFGFTQRRFREFNEPSVDCLFSSAAAVFGDKVIGVLLSGMGRDGAEGMGDILSAGGYTVAQDEQSSVVFGMPRHASEIGVVKQVVSLKEIPGFLISCL